MNPNCARACVGRARCAWCVVNHHPSPPGPYRTFLHQLHSHPSRRTNQPPIAAAPSECSRCGATPCTCKRCPLCANYFAELVATLTPQGLVALSCANDTPTVQKTVARLGIGTKDGLRCCATCSKDGREAALVASNLFQDCEELKPTNTRAKPVVVEEVITNGDGAPAVSSKSSHNKTLV